MLIFYISLRSPSAYIIFIYEQKLGGDNPDKPQEAPRDRILERHLLSKFLGINSSLLSLKFLSGSLHSFFISTKCYSRIDSSFLVSRIFECIFKTRAESGFL
jgi:hypothetical protein